MPLESREIWTLILVIGAGTYLIRLSFLALIGDRTLPPLALKLLRYTPVAVIPGLVAPLILTPGAPADPVRIAAAIATVAVGWRAKSLLPAIAAGAAVFYGVGYLLPSV